MPSMPTTFLKGDLFATPGIRAYAHGCNCAGTMDAGVSVAFKKRFPRMFEEYHQRCADGRFHLGDVFVWTEGDEVVYSLAIQDNWKTRPKLAAFTKALKKTVELAENGRIARVGFPRVGAGVGGFDWPRVRKVMSEAGAETEVELVVFEQFVRAPSPPSSPAAD
jgi:O-acetyl-ADP-ribose deacetylase (regulator of RNase III)